MQNLLNARSAIAKAMTDLVELKNTLPEGGQRQRVLNAIAELLTATDSLAPNEPNISQPPSEAREISGSVRRIDLRGAVNVTVRSGSAPGLTVFADHTNDLAKVLTTVSRGCLTIDSEPTMVVTSNRSGSKQVFNGPIGLVAGRDIIHGNTRIHIAGSVGEIVGDIQAERGIRVEITLPHVTELCVSGAGKLICQDLDQEAIHLDLAGAGSIAATGTVRLLHAVIAGAGSISAYELTSAHAHLDVSGAGSIKATVTESVHASVAGAGKIKIAGNPRVRDTDVTGVGKIKFIDRQD